VTSPPAELIAAWNACGYYELVGMRVTHADREAARLEIAITPAHLQAYGTAHGGVVAGLLDAAMGLAILARLPAGSGCATVEMKLNFTAPVLPGELVGLGRVLHQGRRLLVAASEARGADGRLAACAQGTFQAFEAEGRG
jgi:uncharacterized protein (TIGR00369 family)